MKFEVGDKVRVYGLVESQWNDSLGAKRYGYYCAAAIISELRQDGLVQLKCNNGAFVYANIKQCRKLRKKVKKVGREIWVKRNVALCIRPQGEHVVIPVVTDTRPGEYQQIKTSSDGWTKFREVVEK